MYGTAHTDNSKVYLQLTTSDGRVPELVDFLNTGTNLNYDYPVPDVIVEPVQEGNMEFISWVQKQTEEGKGFDYDDVDPG